VVAALRQIIQQPPGGGQGAVALHVGHVQRPVRNHVQLARVQQQPVHACDAGHSLSYVGHTIAIGVAQQQHLAMGAQAGVHIAIGGYLHPAHIAQALGKDGNFKACGQLEAAQQGFRKWDGAWLENRHHGLAAHGLRRGRVVPTKQRAEGHAGQAHENWSG
jgi:hypothetical protein